VLTSILLFVPLDNPKEIINIKCNQFVQLQTLCKQVSSKCLLNKRNNFSKQNKYAVIMTQEMDMTFLENSGEFITRDTKIFIPHNPALCL
jgi:hypothetical protein